MNMRFVRAALTACLLGAAAALMLTAPLSPASAAAAAAPTEPKVSAAVGKLLAPAAQLMTAGDNAGALVLIKQAQALPDQTPIDTYKINEFLGNVAIKLNDHATAETAYTAMAESPALADIPPEAHAFTLRVASLLATEQKHFANGIKYAQMYIALGGPPDPIVLASMSESYYYGDDFVNAEATAQKAIAATPAGTPPNRGALEVLFGSQIRAKKQDLAIATLETIVSFYDDPDEWGQYIDVSLGTKGIKDIDALHMYRLRLVTNSTGHEEDYTVAASLALATGYPVEAQAFLDAGQAKGVLSGGGKTAALIADARSRAAKDRQSIAAFDDLARKSASGEFDLKLAETYYGYGRYADAEEAARRVLTKGGPKADPNEANMVLGEALAREGKTADAVAAFNAVHNASPGMTRAQHIWLVYANRKYTPVAAAPAPAH